MGLRSADIMEALSKGPMTLQELQISLRVPVKAIRDRISYLRAMGRVVPGPGKRHERKWRAVVPAGWTGNLQAIRGDRTLWRYLSDVSKTRPQLRDESGLSLPSVINGIKRFLACGAAAPAGMHGNRPMYVRGSVVPMAARIKVPMGDAASLLAYVGTHPGTEARKIRDRWTYSLISHTIIRGQLKAIREGGKRKLYPAGYQHQDLQSKRSQAANGLLRELLEGPVMVHHFVRDDASRPILNVLIRDGFCEVEGVHILGYGLHEFRAQCVPTMEAVNACMGQLGIVDAQDLASHRPKLFRRFQRDNQA